MRVSLLLLIVPILIPLASTPGFAADKAKFYDEVTAVDANSITLYRSPTKEAKFTVTNATKVFVDSKLAKIEDVKLGMKATVYHKPDSDKATSISVRSMK